MRYFSDRLSDFEFHDAELCDCQIDASRFTAQVQDLNLHSNAESNPFETDMQLERAQLVLDGFKLISYEHGRALTVDENGNEHMSEPDSIQGEAALQALKEQLNDTMIIFDFNQREDTAYFMDVMGVDPFFTLVFTVESLTVSWDSFKKPSWYAE